MLLVLCALLSLYMLVAIDAFSFSLKRTSWSRFVGTFLLFFAQIVATEFLLGLASILFAQTLIVLNLFISTGLLYALSRKSGIVFFRTYLLSLRTTTAKIRSTLAKDKPSLIVLLLALAFICWVIFLGIIFPATDYDGNSYHLTFIGSLIQNHNIYDAQTSVTWLAGYPKGGELIQAWSVIITHNDMLTDIAQLPFVMLAVYALYQISITLGAAKKHARFSALLFIFLPIVLNQLKTTYVDVMLCALFFTGLALVIQKKLTKLDLLLLGITFSFIISLKPTGLLFVAALAPLLIWNLYRQYHKAFRSYIHPLLLVAAPTVFGFYWYIKNIVLYHTPLYPFSVTVAGIDIFPGKNYQDYSAPAIQALALPHNCAERIWFVWTEQKDWFGCFYNYDTNYAGFGPIWFIILIPAFLLSIYFAIKKRNVLYGAITAILAGLFAVYPSNYYSRYTMFITVLGIVGLSLVLTNLRKLTALLVKALTILLVLSVIATNFVLCNFPPAIVASQFHSVVNGSARGIIYNTTPGPAYVFIEGRLKPGDTVVYDSKPFFIYPLWIPDFSNRVIYLPAKDKTDWINQVQRQQQHATYIFTSVNSRENAWASSNNNMQLIYRDELYEIFQAN